MTRVALSWEARGEPAAPAVIFVHSLGADRSMWQSLATSLAASHRVVTLDLRGHGASPAPPGPYSLDELADDVLGVADAAGLSRFHLCGISLGGLVGLFLAARHPERVESLVAANTAAKIGTAAHWSERCRAVRDLGMAGVADAVMGRWFAPGFIEREPATFADLRRIFAGTSAGGYTACCEAIASADLTSELSRIVAPTLVVAGELDASIPVASARALAEGIAGSELVAFPGVAHLSNLEAKARFAGVVHDFLIAFTSRHGPNSRGRDPR
ncbi:MAG TPA: 3-oxoadipate enol-lactonase [Polyangiaceae bacterium]|nr:3-oxoadipate enol-lactonase [Polyangiaceae bacterium]